MFHSDEVLSVAPSTLQEELFLGRFLDDREPLPPITPLVQIFLLVTATLVSWQSIPGNAGDKTSG
jgi:hypothetical protein